MTDQPIPDEIATVQPTPDQPPSDEEALARAEAEAAAEAAEVAPGAADAPTGDAGDELPEPLTTNDYTVAFSPKQVAVGLAIVAGLVAVVAARRRRGRDGGGGG
jgi:hypothetical protein